MGAVQLFVGCIDDEDRDNSIIRNGKTLGMTGFNYLDYLNGAEVWTNYSCKFAEIENIGFQSMIDRLKKEENNGTLNRKIILSVSELGDILDSIGSTTNEVLFINSFLRQIGKLGEDKGEIIFRGDLQRFFDLHKRFRIHTTNILIPAKFHIDDNTLCNSPKCKRKHKVKVYSYKPFYEKVIKIFDAEKVGNLYNTYQIIKDTLKIPSKKEMQLLENEEKRLKSANAKGD